MDIKILGKPVSAIRLVKWVIGSFLLAGGLLVCLYLGFFRGGVSSNSDHWSHFGEYIGGTVGTLAAIANMVLFAILTVKLSTDDQHRWLTDIRLANFNEIRKDLLTLNWDNYLDVNKAQSLYYALHNSRFDLYLHLVGREAEDVERLRWEILYPLDSIIMIAKEKESCKQENRPLPDRDRDFAVNEMQKYLLAKIAFEKYMYDVIGNRSTK